MDKENVTHVHNGILLNHKEEWNYVISKKMDRTGDHCVKWSKPDSEG
jgi:hypothetical protein